MKQALNISEAEEFVIATTNREQINSDETWGKIFFDINLLEYLHTCYFSLFFFFFYLLSGFQLCCVTLCTS